MKKSPTIAVFAGTIQDGISIYGPFPDSQSAIRWAHGHLRDDWYWSCLDDPDGLEPIGAGEPDYDAPGPAERAEMMDRIQREQK